MWPYLGHGGIPALRECIQRDGYSLVIVDTLTRALGGADQMDLAETALILGELQRLAQDLDVTILLIDHHRKPNGLNPDPVDDLLGSTGKAQPLDSVCGLYRQWGKKEAILRVTSRETEGGDLSLVFDGLTCTWTLAHEPGGVKKDSGQAAVLGAIRGLAAAGELAYTSRIAALLGKDVSNTAKIIGDLVRQGLVREGPKQGPIIPLHISGDEPEPPGADPEGPVPPPPEPEPGGRPPGRPIAPKAPLPQAEAAGRQPAAPAAGHEGRAPAPKAP